MQEFKMNKYHEPDRAWIDWDNAKHDAQKYSGNQGGSGGSSGGGGGCGLSLWGWVVLVVVIIYLFSK